MRLLKTDIRGKTLSGLVLEEFEGEDVPQYAILSHTWAEGQEVLFDDVQARRRPKPSGFDKIKGAAAQAKQDGLEYVWIDTCCINKASSAELSEAINSMYVWYERAAICYAYLSDVHTSASSSESYEACADIDLLRQFDQSRWFTRGWCLQELLAPYNVVFFSSKWVSIGSRVSLGEAITKVTKIELDFLIKARPLSDASVAKRMSWAAFRQTKRPEDVAYCLMGLFQVHMPLLYGEGSKAFLRLQEEIIKQSDDQSLFLWRDPDL